MGNYVSYAANITGASDVQTTIQFARENNVRLFIKIQDTSKQCGFITAQYHLVFG